MTEVYLHRQIKSIKSTCLAGLLIMWDILVCFWGDLQLLKKNIFRPTYCYLGMGGGQEKHMFGLVESKPPS